MSVCFEDYEESEVIEEAPESNDVCYTCIEGKCVDKKAPCTKVCSTCNLHKCNKSFPKCPKNQGKEVT